MNIRLIIKSVFLEYFKDPSLSLREKYYPVTFGVVFPILGFILLLIFKPASFTTFRAVLLFLLMSVIVFGSIFRIFWGYFPRYLMKNFENQQQTVTTSSRQKENAVEVEYEVIDSKEANQDPDEEEKNSE